MSANTNNSPIFDSNTNEAILASNEQSYDDLIGYCALRKQFSRIIPSYYTEIQKQTYNNKKQNKSSIEEYKKLKEEINTIQESIELLKESNQKNKEQKENSKNKKHPVALVDLTEEEIKKYLPPPPIGIPPSSVIRFQQIPFKGDSKDAFYFSNSFNDYYKMDFKQFIKIMPILKAKKRCKSAKLSSQIRKSREKSIEEEEKR